MQRSLRSNTKRRGEEPPGAEDQPGAGLGDGARALARKTARRCSLGANTLGDSDLGARERRGICTRSMETVLAHRPGVAKKPCEKEGLEEEIAVKVPRKSRAGAPAPRREPARKITARTVSMINEQLDRILKRLDSNETRVKEQLDHLNKSMEQLKGKVMEEMGGRPEASPNSRYEALAQKDVALRTPLFSRDKEGSSPLKTRYSDCSENSARNTGFGQREPYPPSSAMALYKVSQDMRSAPQIHSTKKRQKWTEDEVVALIDLVSIYGPSWAKIKKMDVHGWLQRRTQVDLKDKARIIKQHLLETPDIWHQFVSQCANWEAVSVGHSVGHRGVHSS